jgi:hypothetical protein
MMTFKYHIIVFLVTISVSNLFAQTRPTQPKIMVVPSNALMNSLGYMETLNNQGTTIYKPDYNRAFTENSDLKQVISKIGELFSERGFPLMDLEQWLNSIQQEKSEDILLASQDGGELGLSPLDEVLYRAKPDIYLDLDYDLKVLGGPMRAISFNLQAKDAYTNKQIGAASGIGPNTTERLVLKLLEEAVLAHVNNLQTQMQSYFESISSNGREIFVRVQVFDDAGFDLDEELGSDEEELSEIIADWLKNNAVNNSSRLVKQTENEVRFDVRIPLYDIAFGDAPMGAYDYARKLSKYLRKTYNIKTKNITQSLGDSRLIIKGLK